MIQGLDESLEGFREKIQFSYKRANYTFDLDLMKLILLWWVREQLMETPICYMM